MSIVTVALNSERHIRSAIESVLAQNVSDLQYVVIDGKSADDTVAIVEGYRRVLGDRLVVVSEPDSGLYDAMNKGIARATGDVIGILNSDDRYTPGALSAVQQAFVEKAVDIVFGNVEMIDGDEVWIHRASLAGMRDRMTLGHPACFVRRTAYQRWGTFDTRYRINADYDFLLRCYLGGASFAHVDQVLAQFHSGGVSSGSFERRRRELYDIHLRNLGMLHAKRRQLAVLADVWRSRVQRTLGVGLLGRERYERISARVRARRRRSEIP